MNYEKVILELLGRIQILEEKVEALSSGENYNKKDIIQKTSTDDIRRYIQDLKEAAKAAGKDKLVLKSGDIHKDLGLKNALPQVCNAMRQSMNVQDTVLHTTPSGNSSTIQICYTL